jgi:hypothetical protein
MENKPQSILPPERKRRHFPIFWPLLLIAIGIFLFLNSAHMLPGNTLDTLLKLWPLLLVIAGLDGFINHGGFVWSVLLAGLGGIFLLANFGYVQVSVWTVVIRLWPVLFIAWGLDLLIGRHRSWVSWVVGIVIGLALVGGIYWFASTYSGGQAPRMEAINQPLGGAKTADGSISMTAGNLNLTGGASSTNILEAKLGLRTNQSFSQSSSVLNGVNDFSLQDSSNFTVYPFDLSNYVWDVKINKSVPLTLNVDMAAGQMDMDFSTLNLTSFTVKIAAGTINLILPKTGMYSGILDGAASSMNVTIPAGGKLCLQSETAVTVFTVPTGFNRTADCGKTGVPSLDIKNAVGVVTVVFGN